MAAKNHKKYRKEKPWDDPTIDHWQVQEWSADDLKGSLLEESSFATLFPKYREKYLREVWPIVTKALEAHGIACELNLVEGSMTVRTTRKTRDPYVILKSRDLLKLLSRSIPAPQAIKILQDDMQTDIIKIGGIVRNREQFVKRRQRLLGPDGATLKALELLTGCYILVQGNTVACMGDFKGLKQIRKIILDCMKNIHPVYHVKTLMIKRELAKDPALKNEDWSRFLPTFKKKNLSKRKTPHVIREKREYTPFPPAPIQSKIDIQLDTGEYFMNQAQRDAQRMKEKREKAKEKSAVKRLEREKDFVAPREDEEEVGGSSSEARRGKTKKRKSDAVGAGDEERVTSSAAAAAASASHSQSYGGEEEGRGDSSQRDKKRKRIQRMESDGIVESDSVGVVRVSEGGEGDGEAAAQGKKKKKKVKRGEE